MKLKKIISGGQTGADRTGLEVAQELGLDTGGMAPKGYKTDEGNDPSLLHFGLQESASREYPPRTLWNVRNSDATVWFGQVSPGYHCTKRYCNEFGKELFWNPTPKEFRRLADVYETLNIAGNRKSKNPVVVQQVREVMGVLFGARGCRCRSKPCRCPIGKLGEAEDEL